MTDNDETGSDTTGTLPRWLDELVEAGCALRELAAAEWQLVCAELRMARAATLLLLPVMAVAAISAMALGLTLLSLLGIWLAYWFDSWTWSLIVLAGLLLVALLGCAFIARRCLHWLSLPGTRAQWHSLKQRPVVPSVAPKTPGFDMEHSDEGSDQGETQGQGASPDNVSTAA